MHFTGPASPPVSPIREPTGRSEDGPGPSLTLTRTWSSDRPEEVSTIFGSLAQICSLAAHSNADPNPERNLNPEPNPDPATDPNQHSVPGPSRRGHAIRQIGTDLVLCRLVGGPFPVIGHPGIEGVKPTQIGLKTG